MVAATALLVCLRHQTRQTCYLASLSRSHAKNTLRDCHAVTPRMLTVLQLAKHHEHKNPAAEESAQQWGAASRADSQWPQLSITLLLAYSRRHAIMTLHANVSTAQSSTLSSGCFARSVRYLANRSTTHVAAASAALCVTVCTFATASGPKDSIST